MTFKNSHFFLLNYFIVSRSYKGLINTLVIKYIRFYTFYYKNINLSCLGIEPRLNIVDIYIFILPLN